MNLMDLLSGDPPSSIYSTNELEKDSVLQLPNDNLSKNNVVNLSQEVEQPNNGIYYLPTTLTRLQKELMELVVKMFSPELLNELTTKKSRTSIDSLLDSSSNAEHESQTYDKIALLLDQLQTIESHPSLLVDHFMPKKLLLSETSERLLSMSGKLQLFNRIVDFLVEKCDYETGFHVLIVAQSVKELELVEGIIVGKDLNYRNLSTAKLYDDGKSIPDYKNKSLLNKDAKVCLYLATSQQLYNKYTSSVGTVNSKFNLIFSLDSKLDVSSPSIELIRSETIETPIIIPIPVFSLEHISLQIPQPAQNYNYSKDTNSSLFKWNLRMVKTFIVNRFHLFESNEQSFFKDQYGGSIKTIQSWFPSWTNLRLPGGLLQSFNDQLAINFTDEKLIKKIHSNYSSLEIPPIAIDFTNFSYKKYKVALAESLNYRIIQVEEEVAKTYGTKIPEFRIEESKRQLRLDEDEEIVATSYRKLRRLNEDAGFAEKKINKIDSDLSKSNDKKVELERKLAYLEEQKSKPLTEDDLTKQSDTIEKLKEEMKNLSEELTKLETENEGIRDKYQTSSATAASIAAKLAKFTKQNKKITDKMEGPGMKVLPELIKKDTLINYEYQLSKLKNDNEFISSFIQDRIDGVSRERQAILEASTTGSSSRPSNRISRASTPLT
ncbi:structural maintenance of chromosome protein 3 [Scheffersomyces amazonensis]|uniref:structural maintenance of chromosome protein 3 n=1 Tax=Scheffersomyces amazonensis TaxID=1078765 RepID=UPI00315CF517